MVSQIKPPEKSALPAYPSLPYLLPFCSSSLSLQPLSGLLTSLNPPASHLTLTSLPPLPKDSLIVSNLTSQPLHWPSLTVFEFRRNLFSLFGTLNQWRNKRGVDVPFFLKIQCLDGMESDPCLDFFRDLSTCTEGPQR